MRNNSELPKLRISSELHDDIIKILEKLNENEHGLEISLAHFRRLAYKHFIRSLKQEGLQLIWKPK